MTLTSILPAETSSYQLPVGSGGGFAGGEVNGAAALDSSIWFVEYCEICDERQVFIAGGLGLVACCIGCKDERVAQ
jgi:hypothetical protein